MSGQVQGVLSDSKLQDKLLSNLFHGFEEPIQKDLI